MLGSAHGAMRLPPNLVGPDLRRRYRAPLCDEYSVATVHYYSTRTRY
jgi:hypothetical protein